MLWEKKNGGRKPTLINLSNYTYSQFQIPKRGDDENPGKPRKITSIFLKNSSKNKKELKSWKNESDLCLLQEVKLNSQSNGICLHVDTYRPTKAKASTYGSLLVISN